MDVLHACLEKISVRAHLGAVVKPLNTAYYALMHHPLRRTVCATMLVRHGRCLAGPVSQSVHAPRARPRCLMLLPNAALARARGTTMVFMLENLSTTTTGHLVKEVASRFVAGLPSSRHVRLGPAKAQRRKNGGLAGKLGPRWPKTAAGKMCCTLARSSGRCYAT